MNGLKSPFTHGWTTPITFTGKSIPAVAIQKFRNEGN